MFEKTNLDFQCICCTHISMCLPLSTEIIDKLFWYRLNKTNKCICLNTLTLMCLHTKLNKLYLLLNNLHFSFALALTYCFVFSRYFGIPRAVCDVTDATTKYIKTHTLLILICLHNKLNKLYLLKTHFVSHMYVALEHQCIASL